MSFWTYMLQCRDRTLYVGHTDDLHVRLAQHQEGTYRGYTLHKRPLTLVWSETFPTRHEALAAERQIKGWSKAKKLALIRSDWSEISRLAGDKKERPSTSSGRTGEGDGRSPKNPVRPELVEGRHYFLIPHAPLAEPVIKRLTASIRRTPSGLRLCYRLTGTIDALAIPAPSDPARQDGLWRHTCFEAFLQHEDGSYWEFNFSPSAQWAAYSFSDYRKGMTPLDIQPPPLKAQVRDEGLYLDAEIDRLQISETARISLTAIIEEKSGRKSYWALAHPPGEPDFHHPDCFVLDLPPPDGP